MLETISKIRDFRIEQSKEKLKLSSIMINRGLYNDAITYAYLSMFYAVRILLIDKNNDSDNYDKIIELIEIYYEPSGWTTLNILPIVKETKEYKDSIDSDISVKVSRADAERFYKNAEDIFEKILSLTSKIRR
jgi:uncharacterized protein (UPF0332 family)